MIQQQNSFRYPFADIFIYTHNKEQNIWTYRNNWKESRYGEIGFNTTSKWPNGTRLANFGNFQMRISTENRKYLEKAVAKNWYDVGLTPWYDHYNCIKRETTAFELTPRLYPPALPFNQL